MDSSSTSSGLRSLLPSQALKHRRSNGALKGSSSSSSSSSPSIPSPSLPRSTAAHAKSKRYMTFEQYVQLKYFLNGGPTQKDRDREMRKLTRGGHGSKVIVDENGNIWLDAEEKQEHVPLLSLEHDDEDNEDDRRKPAKPVRR